MAKRTKTSPSLPREILFQIAQLLPDEPSFFAYIEALKGSTSDQGSFTALWSLSRTIQHSKLWPNLELHPMGADEWEFAIQAIPLYETVKMHARYHLHRLVDHVNPSTKLVVFHEDKPDPRRMRKWFDQLAQLPVRGLVYNHFGFADRMPKVLPFLLNAWPSLAYLRCLDITVGDQATLESICKCIATSRITELSLKGHVVDNGYLPDDPPHIKLEGVVWTDLVTWLQSTKVDKLDLRSFRFICDNDVSMLALNGALAASDSLHTINWVECAIRISSPLVLPPRLQNLFLPRCTFELVGIDCMLKLLPALPHLTQVRLPSISLSPSDVDVLASVLAQSNVSQLILDACSIGMGGHCDENIQRLADAFEATASLRILHLPNNALGFNGVKAFLAAVKRRPHVTEFIALQRNCPEERVAELKELANSHMSPNTKFFV